MAAPVFKVCLGLLLSIQCVIGVYVSEYTMTIDCGSTVTLGILTDVIKVKLSGNDYYNRERVCDMHIKGSFLSESRFFVQFLDFDIDCRNNLQLYDGDSISDPELGVQHCSSSKPQAVRTTGSNLYIKFTANERFTTNKFMMLITKFHNKPCKSYEFTCNNGWCIDNDLYCDDYDNCGDNSDACYMDHNWWIWVIVGIVVFLVICVVITVIICCACKKSRPGVVIKPNNQPVVHYQPGVNTITTNPVNPWYGNPTAYSQPPPQGTYPTTQAQPPTYAAATGSSIYPPPQSAAPGWESAPTGPPAYSQKEPN